jgi:predicted TIM-barrel fold metal-dependent hydrolase
MSRYDGPIVDLDVHHRPRSDAEVIEYLPKRWRDLMLADPQRPMPIEPPSTTGAATLSNLGRRADAFPDEGGLPGTSYELLREQLLDRHDYHRAVLTHDVGDFACHLNPYVAEAVCRAANDWNIERWLSLDDRLVGLVVAPLGMPDAAAAEIRRVGGHERMVGVLLAGSPLGRPFGDPVYHPVYEAAAEMGLALSIHPAGSDRPSVSMRATPAPFLTVIEFASLQSQQAQHHISSFVVHGVFEKFPSLHLVVKEYGIAWLPSFLWRLDQYEDVLRLESPWVRRRPSDYVREFVKLATQPIETSPDGRDGLADLLQTVEGMEELLCYSSDYPHITFDDPDYVARQLPRGWERKVFCDNACAAYGWTPPPAGFRRSAAAAAA